MTIIFGKVPEGAGFVCGLDIALGLRDFCTLLLIGEKLFRNQIYLVGVNFLS